jgi:PAS domain S-box-containing protein
LDNRPEPDLTAFLANAPDATIVIDRDGHVVFASNRVEPVLGYRPDELVGKLSSVLTPEWLRDVYARYRAQILADPTPRVIGTDRPLFVRRKQGDDIQVEISVNAMGEGEGLRLIYSIRNVSARLSADDTFRLLERRISSAYSHLTLLVDHAPAAIAMFDMDMRYLFASKRWMEERKLGDQNIIGLSHYDVNPNIPERWKEAHRRCLAGEAISTEEGEIIRPDGESEWLRWELQPWIGPDGKVGGLVIFSEIITHRRQTEAALRASNEQLERRVAERTQALEAAKEQATDASLLKSRFLAAASHDLRQPLQAASTYLSVLHRRIERDDQREICEKADRALDAAVNVLSALLDIAKLESGAVRPMIREFPLSDVLDRIISQTEAVAEKKGVALIYAKPDCVVSSDPALLERVVANFASNAVRYTDVGEIEIGCEIVGEIVRIFVRDTGPGIPADALERIFEDYIRLDNPARDRTHGHGLGLSIAKQLSNLLGCKLDVRSTLGQGSTFTIEAPLGVHAQAAPAEQRATASVAPGDARPWILLVEDDPMVSDAMMLLLSASGFEPAEARTGEEAMMLVRAGLRPDVIVSDYRLPGMQGFDVIRRVRQATRKNVPAILLTGDTAFQSETLPEQCDLLLKPVDPDNFIAVLHRLAERPRGRAVAP